MYRYHGAEHKTIACYEAGKPLTVENIRPMTRFHPRCGTSFIIITLLVSILVYSVVPITPELFKDLLNTSSDTVAIMLRTVCKLLLLPIVVGFAYELIKLAGRCDNIVTRIFSAPGLWMQRITTKEPDDSMIEVAIAAVTPCLRKARTITGERNKRHWRREGGRTPAGVHESPRGGRKRQPAFRNRAARDEVLWSQT